MGKNPQADILTSLVQAREEAREILRELHGTIKDAKQSRKEVIDILEQGANLLVMLHVNRALESQIDKVDKTVAQTVEIATNRIYSEVQHVAERLNSKTTYIEDLAVQMMTLSNQIKSESQAMDEWRDLQAGRIDALWDQVINLSHIAVGLEERWKAQEKDHE